MVVVVGNPQAGSRTAGIARRVGVRLAELASLGGVGTIDLAEQPEALLRWGDPVVADWKQQCWPLGCWWWPAPPTRRRSPVW